MYIVVTVTQEEMVATEAHMVGVEEAVDCPEIIPMEARGKTAPTPEGRALPTVPMEAVEGVTAVRGMLERATAVAMEEVVKGPTGLVWNSREAGLQVPGHPR